MTMQIAVAVAAELGKSDDIHLGAALMESQALDQEIETGGRTHLKAGLRAGKLLAAIKSRLAHGCFLSTLQEYGIKRVSAHVYMTVYAFKCSATEHFDDAWTLTEAYRAARKAKRTARPEADRWWRSAARGLKGTRRLFENAPADAARALLLDYEAILSDVKAAIARREAAKTGSSASGNDLASLAASAGEDRDGGRKKEHG